MAHGGVYQFIVAIDHAFVGVASGHRALGPFQALELIMNACRQAVLVIRNDFLIEPDGLQFPRFFIATLRLPRQEFLRHAKSRRRGIEFESILRCRVDRFLGRIKIENLMNQEIVHGRSQFIRRIPFFQQHRKSINRLSFQGIAVCQRLHEAAVDFRENPLQIPGLHVLTGLLRGLGALHELPLVLSIIRPQPKCVDGLQQRLHFFGCGCQFLFEALDRADDIRAFLDGSLQFHP